MQTTLIDVSRPSSSSSSNSIYVDSDSDEVITSTHSCLLDFASVFNLKTQNSQNLRQLTISDIRSYERKKYLILI